MTRGPSAIIFDLDDTLAATSQLWRRAETELLSSLGHAWESGLAGQYKGMNALDVAATIHRILQPDTSKEECQKRMREALFRAFEEGPLEPMPGARAFVRRCSDLAPLALASGSSLPIIQMVLERLEFPSVFQVLLSSESVKRGKPFPDVFLKAADHLCVPPESCLVVEDSLIGAQAAEAAGMKCFLVPSSASQACAKVRTFSSLSDITTADIRAAFAEGGCAMTTAEEKSLY